MPLQRDTWMTETRLAKHACEGLKQRHVHCTPSFWGIAGIGAVLSAADTTNANQLSRTFNAWRLPFNNCGEKLRPYIGRLFLSASFSILGLETVCEPIRVDSLYD